MRSFGGSFFVLDADARAFSEYLPALPVSLYNVTLVLSEELTVKLSFATLSTVNRL